MKGDNVTTIVLYPELMKTEVGVRIIWDEETVLPITTAFLAEHNKSLCQRISALEKELKAQQSRKRTVK